MSRPAPILVYADEGADPFCADCLLRACRQVHGAAEPIDAAGILAGGWQERCAALALPGGADRPYARKLNGRGNLMIRDYVEGGGRYLGICAGAYYACRRIDFTGAEFVVKEDRELGFFPGTAVGSLPELAPPFRVRDLGCTAAADLRTPAGPVTALYWGGCRFEPDPEARAGKSAAASYEVLARYAPVPPDASIAAVRVRVGGGVAVLSGVHAEIGGSDLERHHAEEDSVRPDYARLDQTCQRLREGDAARRRWFASLLGNALAGSAARP